MLGLLAMLAAVLVLSSSLHASTKPAMPVPAIDGDAGPCSTELTVTDSQGNPIDAATVHVHIEYGLFGWHKLDLQAGTNREGKVRFDGLPDDADGVFFFKASKGALRGVAVQDPAQECEGRHVILMNKPPAGRESAADE